MYNLSACPGGGMVDAADLKSVARKSVRVRVPPWAPVCELSEVGDVGELGERV